MVAPGKVIERGTLVLRDGQVEAVGERVSAPADATAIAAEPGWTVWPAFIDAASAVGLDTEATAGERPRGSESPRGPEPKRLGARHELKSVHPEDRILDRVDPGHTSIARHREMGFAVAHVLPDKGVFRGESALLMLRAGPAAEIVARPALAQVIALETSSFMAREYPSSKFGAVATVRQVLLDAQRQAQWSALYAAMPSMPAPQYRRSDEALAALLLGQSLPFFVALNGLDPPRFAALVREFRLQGSVAVARGLGDRADDLVAAAMPVLLPLELPEKPALGDDADLEETDLAALRAPLAAPRLAGTLARAGVRIAFVTAGMKNPRSFPETLAAIVAAGLPQDQALAAVTTTPAALLGLSGSMGTLEPGMQANLLVTDGDLFVAKPKLRHLFVAGYHEAIEPPKTVGDPNAVIDPRGTWRVTSEVMGRSSESTWIITGTDQPDGSRRYAGSSESSRGKRDFISVEVEGNAMTVVSGGPSGEMKVTVVVTGDTFSGESTMSSARGSVSMKFEGRRVAPPEGGLR